MDNKEIIRRLVVGSETIDRMRREIDFVVGTVLGLVMKKHEVECWVGEFTKKHRIERFFSPEFDGCEWRLTVSDCLSPFSITCHLNVGFRVADVYTNYCGSDGPARRVSINNVQRVHESLPLFIEGMRKTYPFLDEYYLRPFVDATDYAERNGW